MKWMITGMQGREKRLIVATGIDNSMVVRGHVARAYEGLTVHGCERLKFPDDIAKVEALAEEIRAFNNNLSSEDESLPDE